LAAHLGRLIDPISILEILGGMLVAILASFALGYVGL